VDAIYYWICQKTDSRLTLVHLTEVRQPAIQPAAIETPPVSMSLSEHEPISSSARARELTVADDRSMFINLTCEAYEY